MISPRIYYRDATVERNNDCKPDTCNVCIYSDASQLIYRGNSVAYSLIVRSFAHDPQSVLAAIYRLALMSIELLLECCCRILNGKFFAIGYLELLVTVQTDSQMWRGTDTQHDSKFTFCHAIIFSWLKKGMSSCAFQTAPVPSFSSTFISDNGPNNGYGYYATKPTITTTYEYEINPDLVNTGSTFYAEQCGNYNSQTDPSGYISGTNLLTQTNRHEWNSSTESHYAFYSNSLSGTNNPGNYVEARVATPGTSGQSFDSATGAELGNLYQNIFNGFSVEPYPVNDDANGNFLGNINYAPYQSCN